MDVKGDGEVVFGVGVGDGVVGGCFVVLGYVWGVVGGWDGGGGGYNGDEEVGELYFGGDGWGFGWGRVDGWGCWRWECWWWWGICVVWRWEMGVFIDGVFMFFGVFFLIVNFFFVLMVIVEYLVKCFYFFFIDCLLDYWWLWDELVDFLIVSCWCEVVYCFVLRWWFRIFFWGFGD